MGATIERPYGIARTVEILSGFRGFDARFLAGVAEALAWPRKPSASSAEAAGR